MEGLAERPEVRSGAAGSRQQRGSAAGPPRGVVFVPDSIPAPFLAEILAQELAGLGIEEANVQAIPLQVDQAPGPAGPGAGGGRRHFPTPVPMDGALALRVIAEGLDREGPQRGFLLGEQGGPLPFGGAVNGRVGPGGFPAVPGGLGFLPALQAESLAWRPLGVTDSPFHFPLAIGIVHPAGHGDGAVVRPHVAVEGMEGGIVNVGDQHALAPIIKDPEAHGATESTEGLLMQFGPRARVGAEDAEAYRLAAIAERPHQQPRAPVLAIRRVADPAGCGGPQPVVTSCWAGFAAPESVITSWAGFEAVRRPQAPEGRTAIPAAFR